MEVFLVIVLLPQLLKNCFPYMELKLHHLLGIRLRQGRFSLPYEPRLHFFDRFFYFVSHFRTESGYLIKMFYTPLISLCLLHDPPTLFGHEKVHETILHVKLTLICPCIANTFSEYNQQDATFLNVFISVRCSKCFRRFFRPSSGALNCTYNVRYLSDHYCYLLLAWTR